MTSLSTPTADGDEPIDLDAVLDPGAVGSVLNKSVTTAVGRGFSARAKDIAEKVLGELLTDDVIEAMEQRARAEVLAALEPEPEPEPAAEPEPEPEKKLCYPNLYAFVNDMLSQIYRRFGDRPSSEIMWCDEWYLHGEAYARLDSLWTAFEQARLGKGSEQSDWWLHHCDPHMAVLMSPRGPFRYCSNEDGHTKRLQPLRSKSPASMAIFPDGHYQRRPSGVYVPQQRPNAKPREILSFP